MSKDDKDSVKTVIQAEEIIHEIFLVDHKLYPYVFFSHGGVRS